MYEKSNYKNNISKLGISEINTVNDNFCNNKTSIFWDNFYDKYQWDIKKITNNGASFHLESGNHDVIVGIIDSGVDMNHTDLKSNFLGGKNLVPANFNNDSSETGDINDINDRLGHGTNVTGQIAANGHIKGVAPNIGFKSYRIFNKQGKTNSEICANAIKEAVNDSVNVINLSFDVYYLNGTYVNINSNNNVVNTNNDMVHYHILKEAIDYALRHNVIIVAAAGNKALDCSNNLELLTYLNKLYLNKGYNCNGMIYEVPGSFDGVITVSSTNKKDLKTEKSNYGVNFIDIAAPGGDLYEGEQCITTNINNSYIFTSGTSFAAPKVSAIAALLLCKNQYLTPIEISNIIYYTAIKINTYNSTAYYGHGLANAYNALKSI
ncbi:S8 family serine peptidase [Clostridium sporogenes]|uniref:S8 family serine peptidase n=1 Tax=Clostridium sporogenes TaxID=1509 RepID=UPI003F8EDDA9